MIDFAFTPVGPEWRERGIVPLTPAELKIPKAHFYRAYGFPNSRNKKKSINFNAKNIQPTANPFVSIEVTDGAVLDAAGISEEHHLALFRDPDGFNGQKPFEPVGMSGGAIFAMHDLTDPMVLAGLKTPRIGVAALITHKSKEQKLLYGTRMSTIIKAIRRSPG